MSTIFFSVLAWVIVGIVIWEVAMAVRQAAMETQRLHQIPCLKCQFFSGSRYLKCALHPTKAMTEAAINCPDYQSRPQILE